MKFTIRGKGTTTIDLNQKHFIAKGGEGSIYQKDGVVYKVCESGKMIPDGKFQELSVLANRLIIHPQDVLIDSKQDAVGYTMKYVPDTYVLCQLFTKAFRTRNGITPTAMLDLVRQMQETINFVHSKKVLLVDLNELNFLVDNTFKDVYFIDVNSYQTKNYPATAIMDSIRDRHSQVFNENTDMFSFAIVSFQMLIGIHPYKGKHPSFTDPKTALDGRMKANLSVLNTAVTYPSGVCQPLSVIPDSYLQWYNAVFEQGKRVAPPASIIGVITLVQPVVKKITGSNNFEIIEVFDFDHEIVSVFRFAGRELVVTKDSLFIDRRRKNGFTPHSNMKVCFTPTAVHPISASIQNRQLKLVDLVDDKILACNLTADSLMEYEGRLYIRMGSQIIEAQFSEIGNNIFFSSFVVGSVLEQATTMYDGVIIQTLFDTVYASVFPATKQCRQIALRELDGYKIVDAKFERGLLMVVGSDKSGKYDRFVYAFDKAWGHQHTVTRDITHTGLNFTVLDTGICVMINEEEIVEIFNINNPARKKEIDDPAIQSDMRLLSKGAQVMITRGSKLYNFSTKSHP